MLTLPPSVRIRVCTTPVDMRCSFDGLAAATRNHLDDDPLSGHLFIFFNRRCDQLRCLYWDRDGYVLVAKRLEKGRFRPPWEGAQTPLKRYELEAPELMLLMSGLELKGAKKRPRWVPPPRPSAIAPV